MDLESGLSKAPVASVSSKEAEKAAEVASTFSTTSKVFMCITVLMMNFNVTMSSSLPSGAGTTLEQHFHVKSEMQKPLPVAVFLIGYIFGPIIFAPASETYGRRPVFLVSFAIHTIFTFACGMAPNWPAFLFFRFMLGVAAAAPQTVSGGLFCDIHSNLGSRGLAVSLLGLTSNVGPLAGPIISGFTSTTNWRWQFWWALVGAGATWPLLLWMPETFAPVLNKKTAALTREKNGHEIKQPPFSTRAMIRLLSRPIRILTEPLVFFTDLFILYQYIIFFLYFGVYPIIFHQAMGMPEGIAALMFIPTGIGAVIAIGIYMAWDWYHTRSLKQGKKWAMKEEYRRLPLACLGGPLFALSEFWLGWAARPGVHWSIAALSGIPLGIGIDLTFLALNNYLTDAYDIYSSSALASSVFTRNVLAAVVIPLATHPLYKNLGTDWACSLLGFLCLALTPIPFAFIKWGPVLRKRSPFCQRLARMKESSGGILGEGY